MCQCIVKKPKNKKATILVENIVFIVLNIVFISIMVLFVYSRANGIMLLEESYAKNIALLIDSSKPGMEFYLDMEKAINRAEKEKWPIDQIVNIKDNIVTVKLSKNSEYSYSFFNNVNVIATFDKINKKGFYFYVDKYLNTT